MNTIRLHMGNAHMACDPKGEIYMSKFEIPTVEALKCAFHGFKADDFLREVADAIDDDRKVVIDGKKVLIESPNGDSVWRLAELFTAPPSNPNADVTYSFMREVIEE